MSVDKKEPEETIDAGRRSALSRLGLVATTAYIAPVLMTLSSPAHASSGGGSGGSGGGGRSGGGSGGGPSDGPGGGSQSDGSDGGSQSSGGSNEDPLIIEGGSNSDSEPGGETSPDA